MNTSEAVNTRELCQMGSIGDRLTSTHRLMEPDGTMSPEGMSAGLDVDLGKSMLRQMMLARALDSEALALQRQGELSLWLMCRGQEAAQVGSALALHDSDMIFPSYREHAVALCRGISVPELLAQWRGTAHGGWDPAAYSMQVNTLVLGAQTLHAAGYAMGVKMDRGEEIVVVYVGDGATSEGDFSEALNWAAAYALPLLFIVQNNQWAISTPTEAQMKTSIAQRAAGFGVASWHVDGNDAFAMHDITRRAAEWVRAGHGPALIEAETYRMGGHSTSDDPTKYRTDEELVKWSKRDPIDRLEGWLRAGGIEEAYFQEVELESQDFRERVRRECTEIADPDLALMFSQVYADEHPELLRERVRFVRHRQAVSEEN